MTQDDIINMAREAGITTPEPADRRWHLGACSPLPALERFAALAAAAERKRIETSRPPRMSVSIERARQEEREACIDIVTLHGGSAEIKAAIRARNPT